MSAINSIFQMLHAEEATYFGIRPAIGGGFHCLLQVRNDGHPEVRDFVIGSKRRDSIEGACADALSHLDTIKAVKKKHADAKAYADDTGDE